MTFLQPWGARSPPLFHRLGSPESSFDRRPRRRFWRGLPRSRSLQALLVLGLLSSCAFCYLHGATATSKLHDAFELLWHGDTLSLLGRRDIDHPVKRCCVGDDCLVRGREPRYAVVTYIRTNAYLPLLQQLECSLRKSNPSLDLAVMLVREELSQEVVQAIMGLNRTIIYVKPLAYANTFAERYKFNWLKVRAFGFTQYDAIVLLDSDVVVVESLMPLFNLPTDFAASWNQIRTKNRRETFLDGSINGGVLFIRPCAAVEKHMMGVLQQHPRLRFIHGLAEQDFFTWYFRYTGMMLPLEWNTMASESMEGGLTVGGVKPRIVHFIEDKPFQGAQPGIPGHEYLCK